MLLAVITTLKTEKGLALQDLIAGAYDFLDTVELPKQSRIYLLDHLGSTECVDCLHLEQLKEDSGLIVSCLDIAYPSEVRRRCS